MCGIVGYIGTKQASPILISGLKRLEYRGYDSAGLTIWDGAALQSIKRIGKIVALSDALKSRELLGTLGIAHTRWATHGVPSEINAHPHLDCHGTVAIVHNGIIENYVLLKKALIAEGHAFVSQTDSEVLAHLIEKFHETKPLEQAVMLALRQVEGAYGLVVVSAKEPNKMVVAKKGSPLVIGVGQGEYLVASDASAIIDHTKHVIYLDDGEIGVLETAGHRIFNISDTSAISKTVEEITWNLDQIEKGGFDSFMIKEIFEQPESITNAMRGRVLLAQGAVKLSGLETLKKRLAGVKRIIIVACGTSWHAGLVGEFMLEELAGLPVEVEYASEFRYRKPVIALDCLVVVISQSGETADTLAALQLAKEHGALTFGICNVVGSSIARQVDAGCYLHAGPEIGVASTKAFTSQLTVLTMLAVYLATARQRLDNAGAREILSALNRIPELVTEVFSINEDVLALAKQFYTVSNFLYLGRGYNFPVALEGALKLKELSYIHAEGYPAAEMKHGPIALIDKDMPVVFIATHDSTYDKIISNILEVKARGGRVIAVALAGDTHINTLVEHTLFVPKTIEMLSPIINTIPLQLLAYHIATLKGCDVDKPRNLAKSVTVE